ncbi:MAG: sulfotransferase [Novosphingobium sp.]|nr:sulfotransferase [Novosphingobium sp.]MCP5404202.1 sulfotransferase [Novosphingobium sp.]
MNTETHLSFDCILTLAERDSGAVGLADEGLISRARAVVDWVNERGPYGASQLRAMQAQIKNLLATRLRLAADRQRYPAIAGEKIERPIFIIGFARAGTTLVHSLLAEDPGVYAPQSWHMYSPSPPPGAGPVAPERIAYSQRMVEEWMNFCPGQKPMHPYIDKGAYQLCEDEEVIALDFRTTYPYHFYKVPTMSSMLVLDPDPTGSFMFHREFLQHLQWNTGVDRWVCKGPSHQGNLSGLFEAYPDALCIWPHRPIGEIFASIVTLTAMIYDTITGEPSDIQSTAKMLADGMRAGLDQVLANDMIDDPRIMHLPFREVTQDPIGVIRRIYGAQGREVTAQFESRVQAWLDAPENAVDRYGRYPYSYDVLGLEREGIEELFADYSKRFGLE